MRKGICLILVLIVCLSLFASCKKQSPEVYCRVMCVKEDGFIAWTEEWGNIYIQFDDQSLGIKTLNTVIIQFTAEDLISAEGTFVTVFGKEESYSYILAQPRGIRFPDPSAGEPTFG